MDYLNFLIRGFLFIIRTSHGLDQQCALFFPVDSDSAVISELSRVLPNAVAVKDKLSGLDVCARELVPHVKQLVELVKSDNYVECIQEVSDFTVQALQQWHWSPNRYPCMLLNNQPGHRHNIAAFIIL